MAPHAEPAALTDTSSVILNDPLLTKEQTHAVFTLDDVLPHRHKSKPPSTAVAAFSEADMFKSKGAFKKPLAKRFDHRLSEESRSRTASSLKGAMKHFKSDTISLCGGLPSRYVSFSLYPNRS
jgi:aromatic amino acid aminotransferase I / 2-aminoadipate transaminase